MHEANLSAMRSYEAQNKVILYCGSCQQMALAVIGLPDYQAYATNVRTLISSQSGKLCLLKVPLRSGVL